MEREYDHHVTIEKSDGVSFRCNGDETPEIRLLIQNHEHKILRWVKTNMVALYWNDGDQAALATLMPTSLPALMFSSVNANKFKTFMLPFPKNITAIR